MEVYTGIARDVNWKKVSRYGASSYFLLTFRLECLNKGVDVTRNIPVRLKAGRLCNLVNEGDRVVISGRFNRYKILHPKKLHNTKTGAIHDLAAKSTNSSPVKPVLAALCLLGSVLISIFVWNQDVGVVYGGEDEFWIGLFFIFCCSAILFFVFSFALTIIYAVCRSVWPFPKKYWHPSHTHYGHPVHSTNPHNSMNPNSPHNPHNPMNPNSPHNPHNPMNPSSPHNPHNPMNPSSPHNPHNPMNPNSPHNPHNPMNPNSPHNPHNPMNPNSPHNPHNPMNPNSPHNPHNPMNPNSPHNPHNPMNPNNPHNPHNPMNPSSPHNPHNPMNPNNPFG